MNDRFKAKYDYSGIEDYQPTPLLTYAEKFNKTLSEKYEENLSEIFEATQGRKLRLKYGLEFGFGCFLGLLFYGIFLRFLELPSPYELLLTTAVCLYLGIGNVFSSQIRCISLLAIPAYGTNIGQSFLRALIFTFVFTGPLTNILNNGKEAIRVFTCSAMLTYNMTMEKYQLIQKPIFQGFREMRADRTEMDRTLKIVNDLSSAIHNELDDETPEIKSISEHNDYIDRKEGLDQNDYRSKELERKYQIFKNDTAARIVEKKYIRKIQFRCEDMISKAYESCRSVFVNLFDSCQNKLPSIVNVLCYVVKLTFLCNIISLFGGREVCDPGQAMGTGFGKMYYTMVESKSTISNEFQNARVYYKLSRAVVDPAVHAVHDIYVAIADIVDAFASQRVVLGLSVDVITRLITIYYFIVIIFQCLNYVDKYLNDVEWDNSYITLYFRKIDFRRFKASKLTLLPMKEADYRKFTDVYSLRWTDQDWNYMKTSFARLILDVVAISIIVGLDFFIYQMLDSYRQHGYIEYHAMGKHDLALQIKGVGMLASIVRSIANSFNVKQRINKMYTNKDCLPRPLEPSAFALFMIYGLYALVVILVLLNSYIRRLNRIVCSYFYPKMEKKRIIYLYNKQLKRRISFLQYRKDLMEKRSKIPDDLGFFLAFRLANPKWFSWLRNFDIARRKCIICQNPEPKEGGESRCQHQGCYFYYDQQCWDVVCEGKCLGCPSNA